ncbi:hypothetical protein BDA96_01G472400 [Sorghum bicolor]|uniref:Uncharacterized protein n=2 Tax=Sorghum bicolor TaxID=4558 RepID=A0A921S5I2_SORBI|nr:hypothetical protein BDA96_01G472400 [Sorghum bicolor]OQU92947.1 hypothetical protein SORBI_3001G443850 [Sorghum bicolor]
MGNMHVWDSVVLVQPRAGRHATRGESVGGQDGRTAETTHPYRACVTCDCVWRARPWVIGSTRTRVAAAGRTAGGGGSPGAGRGRFRFAAYGLPLRKPAASGAAARRLACRAGRAVGRSRSPSRALRRDKDVTPRPRPAGAATASALRFQFRGIILRAPSHICLFLARCPTLRAADREQNPAAARSCFGAGSTDDPAPRLGVGQSRRVCGSLVGGAHIMNETRNEIEREMALGRSRCVSFHF